MSGTTTHYGFDYPDLDDDPNGPVQIETLAEGIDTKIYNLESGLPTSHVHAVSGLTITMATGWSTAALTYEWEVNNGILELTVDATRSGAALTASSTGNLTNTLVWTIAAPYRPSCLKWGNFCSDGLTSGGAHLNTAGQMFITDAHPTSQIATSDVVHTSWMFAL